MQLKRIIGKRIKKYKEVYILNISETTGGFLRITYVRVLLVVVLSC